MDIVLDGLVKTTLQWSDTRYPINVIRDMSTINNARLQIKNVINLLVTYKSNMATQLLQFQQPVSNQGFALFSFLSFLGQSKLVYDRCCQTITSLVQLPQNIRTRFSAFQAREDCFKTFLQQKYHLTLDFQKQQSNNMQHYPVIKMENQILNIQQLEDIISNLLGFSKRKYVHKFVEIHENKSKHNTNKTKQNKSKIKHNKHTKQNSLK